MIPNIIHIIMFTCFHLAVCCSQAWWAPTWQSSRS